MDGRGSGKPSARERTSGIDLRNPAALHAIHQAVDGVLEQQVAQLCAPGPDYHYLVHLYWPGRECYFEENQKRMRDEGRWLLVATPGHGRRRPTRPSVNFFVADQRFAEGYPAAAQARNLRHGLVIDRDLISAWSTQSGYELADVKVGHPNAIREHTEDQDWKLDSGNHRYGAVHDLRYAGVVRLATPISEQARHIWIPSEAIVRVW
jgi:hypothetical protein